MREAGLWLAQSGVALPRPSGWIGTTTEWAQGLGIAFALLDLALLASAWWTLRTRGETPGARALLALSVIVLPLAVVFFGYHYGLEAAKTVNACGACHVMTPYARDLRDPGSDTLAALHFKNRYIQENHCYTCHADYGMFGTVQAKWEGLGHVVRYATGAYRLPIKIAHPYPSVRCLDCHGESQKYAATHDEEARRGTAAGAVSCLDCHGPAHPAAAPEAAR